LELYIISIPSYGHVRNFSELVFETFHKHLKKLLKRSTHHNKHITSVEGILVNDWLARFSYCLSDIHNNEILDYNSPVFITMKRLLFGEKSLYVKGDKDEEKSFLLDFVKKNHKLLENKIIPNLYD